MRESDQKELTDHYLDLYKIAYDLLHDPTDVEDAVQEALAKTLAHPLVGSPFPFCVRVLKNECKRMLKRNTLVLKANMSDLNVAAEGEYDAAYEEEVELVGKCRDQLPQRMQELLDLYLVKGYSMREIAEKSNRSIASVRREIVASYKHIREQMTTYQNHKES